MKKRKQSKVLNNIQEALVNLVTEYGELESNIDEQTDKSYKEIEQLLRIALHKYAEVLDKVEVKN